MFDYMHTVLNGLKAWVTGEVNKLLSKIDNSVVLNPDGTIPQKRMATDPTEAMQIATKKYVDDHAAGDAVLYTAQTLTDAQKKQARENIDAAAKFVVNATPSSDFMSATLDKTFAQIKEAISAGKTPIVSFGNSSFLKLEENTEKYIVFAGLSGDKSQAYVTTMYIYSSQNPVLGQTILQGLNSAGSMPQLSMASDPTQAMQIATKQYVDNHAGGGAITTLHINVTAVNMETMEATFTADKTPNEMQQAACNGPVWCVVTFAAGVMETEAVSFGVPPAWYGGYPAFGGLVEHIHSDAGNNNVSYVIRAAGGLASWVFDARQFGG